MRLVLVLTLICLTSGFVLNLTHKSVKSRIEFQAEIEQKSARKEIFPEASEFKYNKSGALEYYEVYHNEDIIGYCLKKDTLGYGGAIEMLVGIDLKGNIKGVKILSHQETPGLGSKITEIRERESSPWFLRQFTGKRVEDLDLKTLDAITGATISSKAVINGVKEALEEFFKIIK